MTTQGLFMHNVKLYEQIDRMAMGSPLGPTLSKFFLGCLKEKNFVNNCNVVPKLYFRYVNDTYVVFDILTFLDILTS